VIRIRPGRSWRLNPAYVEELRALDRGRARGFTGADILDVLGVEVDGVDIAAGVGEARVLVAVDELAAALLRIGEGEPAAQATIGPGPTELVLEARGPDLLLTLVSLAPPARVLAGGLLVEARKMRAATLHAARGLLLDLLAISAAVGDAPLARRLGECCAELARRPVKAPRRWPAREAAAKAMVFFPAEGRRRAESLQMQLPPETVARLREQPAAKHAPLAPHLGHGSLALTRRGAPGLACEGTLYLMVRNLLGEAERLVEAWEAGAREFALSFGPYELRCDLTTDQVHAPGWRKPAGLPALRLARLVALLALGYAGEAHKDDGPARDLRERALLLERHCEDLETGDLRRAPETAPVALRQDPLQGPLAPGRMRRLVYREAWRSPAAGALRMLPLSQGPLLIELPGRLEACEAETGDLLWKVDAAPGAVARGQELFYTEPGDALARIDATTGEVRWKRRMRGAAHPAQLWALPFGVLRSLPGEGLALVTDAGTLAFRAKLPGGAPPEVAAADRVLVAALASGSLAGIDPADGRLLWKRRCKASALHACGARALVLSEGALSCIDAQSGEPVWECEVPGEVRALAVAEGCALLLAHGELLSFALATGTPGAAVAVPWARHLTVGDEPETVVATGDDGAAARFEPNAFGPRAFGPHAPGPRASGLGPRAWSLPPEAGVRSAPAQLQRGVLLLQRSRPSIHDAAEGFLLAELPEARAAVLAPDLSIALMHENELSVHRLTTHLSVL
jgi:hypothetical protein